MRGMRQIRFGFGLTPVVKALMIANGVVFLLQLIVVHGLDSAPLVSFVGGLALHPDAALLGGRLWQLGTYMFLHDPMDLLHIVFNMLVLFFFGGLFEARWGRRGFLRYYLGCGLGAGLVGALAGVVAPGWFGAPVVGASGALSGLLMAFALLYPEQTVQLWFVMPIRARQLIWAMVAIDLIMFLTGSPVAIMVHFGGLLTGYLMITGNWRPARWGGIVARLRARLGRRARRYPDNVRPFDPFRGGRA